MNLDNSAQGSTSSTAPDQARVMPGAWSALLILIIINLFNYIDRQILSANISNIEKLFLPLGGLDNKTKLGYLAMAFMVAYMVFAPLFGWLASFVPRWKLIGAGVIIWSLASGGSGVAGTFLLLLITRCLVGIGEAAYGPAAPTVISDLYPVEKRGQVLAWFYAAIPVGSALGYVLGGQAGYPLSFYLVVPPGIILGIICFFMPEPRSGQTDLRDGAQARRATMRDYLVLFKTPSYVLDSIGMTMLTFAIGGIAIWMPDYIHVFRGEEGLDRVNLIFGGIVVISGLVATLLGGIAGDKLRPYFSGSYFLVSGVAMMLAFPAFLAVLWTPFPYAWVWIFISCFLLFFNTGPTNTILANVTHPAVRAQGFALNIFIIHALGDAISPTVIGWVADTNRMTNPHAVLHAVSTTGMLASPMGYGPLLASVAEQPPPTIPDMDRGFLLVSFTILIGAVAWLIGVPFLKRDTERAPYSLDRDG